MMQMTWLRVGHRSTGPPRAGTLPNIWFRAGCPRHRAVSLHQPRAHPAGSRSVSGCLAAFVARALRARPAVCFLL